jgi:hypothetical protein
MVKRDSNFNPVGTSRGIRRGKGSTADWAGADAIALRDAICAAAIVGGALRFGYSRDGGAYAIGIYGDGEPYTEFVKPIEDIDITLVYIKELFEAYADEKAQAAADIERHRIPSTAKGKG